MPWQRGSNSPSVSLMLTPPPHFWRSDSSFLTHKKNPNFLHSTHMFQAQKVESPATFAGSDLFLPTPSPPPTPPHHPPPHTRRIRRHPPTPPAARGLGRRAAAEPCLAPEPSTARAVLRKGSELSRRKLARSRRLSPMSLKFIEGQIPGDI